jgi:hypothetical protein
MEKYLRFIRSLADNKNSHTPRARRRKMERELKKLNESDDKSGGN